MKLNTASYSNMNLARIIPKKIHWCPSCNKIIIFRKLIKFSEKYSDKSICTCNTTMISIKIDQYITIKLLENKIDRLSKEELVEILI